MTAKEKMTAPIASVGADVGQPYGKESIHSISEEPAEINDFHESLDECPVRAICKPQIMRKIQQNQQIKRIQMIWKQFP